MNAMDVSFLAKDHIAQLNREAGAERLARTARDEDSEGPRIPPRLALPHRIAQRVDWLATGHRPAALR